MKCRTPILKYADTLLKAIASLLSVWRVAIVSKLATAVNISVFPSKYQQETSWSHQKKTLWHNIWIKPLKMLRFNITATMWHSGFFFPKRRNKNYKNSSEVFTGFFFCESEVVKAVITVDAADSSMMAAESTSANRFLRWYPSPSE